MLNLLDLLARHGISCKKVSSIHGGEYHSPCPACGGKDRFHCWPDRVSTNSQGAVGVWGCRGCDDSGDIISFMVKYDGLSFVDACKQLCLDLPQNDYKPVSLKPRQQAAVFTPPQHVLPPSLWIEKNTALVQHAHQALLQTPDQLAWLAARGIDADAVRRFSLGWLVGDGKRKEMFYTRPLAAWGLPVEEEVKKGVMTIKKLFKFPRGLVIPRLNTSGQCIGLRIRRTNPDCAAFAPDTRYMAFRGAKALPLLVLPQGRAIEQTTIVVVESELDAILIATTSSRLGLPVGALAILSNTGRPDAATHTLCTQAARLLIAMDFDDAGAKGLHFWLSTYHRAKDWPVPAGKDPGEAYVAGVDIGIWLQLGLPPVFSGLMPVSPVVPINSEFEGSVEKKIFEASAPSGVGASACDVPAEVHQLLGYFKRFPFLSVDVGPGACGLNTSYRFRRDNYEELKTISELLFSSTVQRFLDKHPVQQGTIDRHNLLGVGQSHGR